jgi:CSLREA domain-containing protein
MLRIVNTALLAWLAAASPAAAATITVNTTSDVVAADNQCSLREAINAANSDSVPFVGPGECAAGSGGDTVAVPGGTFTLTISGPSDDGNAQGDLDLVGGPLTIDGIGAGFTTIDANHIDRAIDVRPGASATIEGLTVTGGRPPNGSNGGTGVSGGAGRDGGGIRNAGVLTVLDTTVSGNAAGNGGSGGIRTGSTGSSGTSATSGGDATGGDGGPGGAGGGIFNTGALTLTRVTVKDNAAGAGGAGGSATGGQGGSSTGDSHASGSGGEAFGGSGGAGGAGGGVAWVGGGALTIDQSYITGNIAGAGGVGALGQGGFAGIAGGSPGFGGSGGSGIGGDGGAGGAGGGITASDGALVTNTLIESNTAGAGARGGNATGGDGGHVTGSSGFGGSGGLGQAGAGGAGGSGAGIAASSPTVLNVTITGGLAGGGAASGSGKGGDGGSMLGGGPGTGGHGGTGNTVHDGGNGGSGGGLELLGIASVRHATITSNSLGSGGAVATAIGGKGGDGNGGTDGEAGFVLQGTPGSGGTGGAAHAGGGTATLQNSIAAGNAAPSCVGITDGGHDISFPDAGCPGANVDPKLAALADNGGPTKTQAPGPGSPALDAVPASGAGCATTDQRGVARPQGAGCEIGAYEHAPPGVTTGDATGVSSGAATLQGLVNPNARVSSYHFEFGTTTAYGGSTAAQTTGAGVSPEAVAATVTGLVPGTTYHFRLVATNADGTTAGADRTFVAQGPPDTTRPRFLSASLRPTVFAVNRRGRAEVPVAAAKRGTTFRYRLSEDARVVFTIARALPGRRVGGACRKPTARNRTRPRCIRYVRVRRGRFAATAHAGANRKRFSGKIGRRALKPGRYRASLVATDAAGNASRPPKRLTFRVIRG